MLGVVIPYYNHAWYIAEALESVAWQSYPVDDVVIVDDGSRDNLYEALKEFAGTSALQWLMPEVIVHKENLGPAAARNTGIARLIEKGCDLIQPLDADDMLLADFLTVAVKVLDQGYDIVYPNINYFGLQRGIHPWPRRSSDDVVKAIRSDNEIISGSLMRKEVWLAVKERNGTGYDPETHKPEHYGWEDWLFWLEATALGFKPMQMGAALYRYRVHTQNGVHKANNNWLDIWAYMKDKMLRLYDVQLPDRPFENRGR